MSDNLFSWEAFERVPLIGIVRHVSAEDLREILPLYQDAGFTTLEITMNTTGVEDFIPSVLQDFPGLNVGAGTVCSKKDLKKALQLGAQFIVTPIVDKGVIKACVAAGIPIFPGAYTPTEIFKAWSLGASMVKVYPATALGPDYIKDLKAPLQHVKLMPTGGVNLDNLLAFKRAGASGFGIGSQLFDKQLIKAKDWVGLEAHFARFITTFNEQNDQLNQPGGTC
jgi:2-dehydro-3-deoxyphosphogluconate aldolase/(4S)-4-hydroxy-2-oxoglutarate aldolase